MPRTDTTEKNVVALAAHPPQETCAGGGVLCSTPLTTVDEGAWALGGGVVEDVGGNARNDRDGLILSIIHVSDAVGKNRP